ncbi:MAG TPA: tetratricopeptide repeat protein [Sumerlaeia bacterium]|nr:tetratricopeptide repeat protein [Sumerlaeia bacterium]
MKLPPCLIRVRLHLFLVALVALAYSNSPLGEYCYDDTYLIRDCKTIESWAGLVKLVSRDFGPAFGDLHYRPMAPLTFFADAVIFGKSPFCSRSINIGLHVAVGLALFGLWRIVFGRDDLAFLAAAIFLCHPIATEVVNSPGFRKDLLSTLFMVCSLRMACAAVKRGSRARAVAAAALWFLALLAKEPAFMAVLLAPILCLPDTGSRNDAGKRPARGWTAVVLSFAVVFAAYLILYVSLRYASFEASWPGGKGPFLGFLNFCRTFLVYARLWLVPVGLSIGHDFHASTSYGDWRLWAGGVAFAVFALGSLALLARRRGPAGVGGAWACVCFVPVFQILPTPQLLAERYAYAPHAGLALLAASLLLARRDAGRCPFFAPEEQPAGETGERARGWRSYLTPARGVLFLLAAYAVLTFVRNRDWSDDVTLNISRYEKWDSAEGRAAVGALYYTKGWMDKAEASLREAIAMDADRADAHRSLGVVLMARGELDRARRHLARALELDPGDEVAQGLIRSLPLREPEAATSP